MHVRIVFYLLPASGKTTREEVYTYSYDYADRVSKVEHTLGGSKITLYDCDYDKFRRLYTKLLHGSATNKQSYTYNVCSWLTGISGTRFTQNLYYNTGVGTAKYNGSISSMTWKSGNESTVRGYKFTYDGLDNTHGDYITFVDSDDYIEPNMIEFLSENIGDTNIAMCGYTSVAENGTLSPQENVTVTDGIISTDTFWNYFYTDTRIYYVTLWAKLYKSHLWNNVRFPLNTLHEDEFAVHQIISQCSKIAVSKKPLYFYLQREGSIMHTQFKTENLNAAEGMLDRCQFFFNKKEYTLAEKALSMAMYSIIKGYGILGENGKIKELYKQFRLMYRKLVFKNTSMKFKYKCGIFALNKQIFIKLKK